MANDKDRPKHKTTYDIANEMGIMPLTPSQLIRHAMYCAKVGKPLLVRGRPGVGKTAIMEQLANQLKKMLIVERLNGRDPTDMGLPYIYSDERSGHKRHDWTSPQWFQAATDPVPEEYPGGWMMGFDEVAQAMPAMQNRIGEMLHEGRLNNVPMHPKVWVILLANFAQDKAATFPIPRQIENRCSSVILAPSVQDFIDWGSINRIRPEVLAFAKLFPDCLDAFDADAHVNPTARSLAAISPMLDQKPAYEDELPLYSSIIGKGYGAQFTGFLRVYRDLPKLEDIVARPTKEPIPDEDQTDVMCALAAMLGRAMTKVNADPVVKYLLRLPSEFCVFALRDATHRDPELKKTPSLKNWAIEHGDVLS